MFFPPLRSVRLFPLLGLLLAPLGLDAQVKTWTSTSNTTWSASGNWSPSGAPGSANTATFGSSGITTPTITATTSISAVNFLSGAQAFTIALNSGKTLTLTGAGITNNSGSSNLETFNNSGSLKFSNSASASTTSTGSSAIRINTTSTPTSTTSAPLVEFDNSSTAGNAVITDTASPNSGKNNSVTLTFNTSASAGSATIAQTASGAGFGTATIIFNNNATASTANITSTASGTTSAIGEIDFNNSATAGSATITLADSSGQSTNSLFFKNNATAGSAHLNIGALGGANFWDDSTAGSATINVTDGSGQLSFNGTTANAGTASITSVGAVYFQASASASSANITMNSSLFSLLDFQDSATAANANITLNASALTFEGTSTGGNATISLTNGSGMNIQDAATGGNATLTLDSSSTADVSLSTASNLSLGSIAGAGQIYLGGNQLQVGGNNASTTFSGQLFDGGFSGGTGGGLTKVGTGTLELDGNNQYTGPTNVNGGTLLVNVGNYHSSLTTVNSGGTLGGFGYVGPLTIASGGTVAPGATPNSFGTLHVLGNTIFSGGGSYQWQVDNVYAPFARWDLLDITGALDLTGLGSANGSRFDVVLQSLTNADVPGNVFNFDPGANYTFKIASATGGITGFVTTYFTIDTSGFTNLQTGTWSLQLGNGGDDLDLVYTGASAIPEPSTYAAIFGLLALGRVAWRRRLRFSAA